MGQLERLAKKHRYELRSTRERLESRGRSEADIEARLEVIRRRQDQECELLRSTLARKRDQRDPMDVDDRGFKPSKIDPLLTGAARATGETAAAVKRGRSVTAFQYRERTS